MATEFSIARQAASQARTEAWNSGDTVYNGLPCKNCGGTLRHRANGSCFACEVRNRPDRVRMTNYRLSASAFEEMKTAQGGCCAICGKRPKESLHVDHCHVTGAVRKLLCRNCNSGLGLFNDDPAIIQAAADYRRQYARQDPGGPEEAA